MSFIEDDEEELLVYPQVIRRMNDDDYERLRLKLLAQRLRYLKAVKQDGVCCPCCEYTLNCCTYECDLGCTYRFWALLLLTFKIVSNVGLVIFGGWGISSWFFGWIFAYIILCVGIGMFLYIVIFINNINN